MILKFIKESNLKFSHYLSVLILLVCGGIFFNSCKQVKLADADRRFKNGEYFEAAGMYRKVYRKIPPKNKDLRGVVAFRMAESYRLSNNVVSANAAYVNALRFNQADTAIRLQYARTLHKAGNYPQAAEQYKAYLKPNPDNKFAQNGLLGVDNAPEMKDNPTKYTVKKMDVFNSRRGEFSPMLLPPDYDLIYITTNRDDVQGEAKSTITGVYNNDIFVARKDETGKWMKPETAGAVNTEQDEGTPTFSASGNLMFYTYCDEDPDHPTNAAIYKSRRADGSWGKGERLAFPTDTAYMYAHPALSPDGYSLFFVSDMPGGYGGKDIWRAAMFGEEVSYVENLGPDINTAGDEMFPYVRNDSTLYFSSDGHPGLGGLDIFKAAYDKKTKRWSVNNMGVPINSQGDDFGMTFDKDTESGFFSSNRGEARGSDHIYSFEYPVVKVSLEGFIVDKDDEFVPNATIRVVGNDGTNEKFNGKPDGTYRFQVKRGVTYVLLASAEGYLNSKMDLRTVVEEKDSLYYVDFVLYSINKPAVLENIFYDFDKAALRDESKKELDDLIELLELNPNVTIELSAHTDRKGSNEYNECLSQRRAQSVVDYLIAHRIEKDRLTVAGYGKRQPKVVTKGIAKKYDFLKEGDILNEQFVLALPPEQQEIADQINRRTEFKVLSTTYNLR
ncbi:PorE family type IX secretion system protein [Dysgonomonas macrotermitis]|uniref:Peptidoglycan-associated lipoprotein n=1 Tax=Dysgonomonas macrotermitis TaxID=1346286 RepID=A0A1M5BBL3_9BACT|nr:OmpA family protein [Dysgonomonas macrotermitis]SHF39532.1 peptidoglycan-associated lipoprotein [Dysgonomonas macrotermitis]